MLKKYVRNRDLEMLKVLTGEEKLGMRIDKALAAGDPECEITYYVKQE